MKHRFLALLFALTAVLTAAAQDSLRISLLTCGAGEEAYALYGHTAIRVQDVRRGTDTVYNYGMFDFDAPHFVWRFSLGQTDYFLGVQDFGSFVAAYAARNRWVDEQELLLLPEEKASVFRALEEQAQQEGWTYRYNFLKDNCTTRALMVIEQALKGELLFPPSSERKTYREVLHEFAQASPWNLVGNDLLLGAEADEPISPRAQCFSPIYAERYLEKAVVRRSAGEVRPLAEKPVRIVVAAPRMAEGVPPLYVLIAGWLLVAGLSVWEVRRQRVSGWCDAALLLVHGVAGSVIAFLFFFSEHPAVGSNWNFLWLNPLSLLALPLCFRRTWRRGLRIYYIWYALSVALFVGATLCGMQRIIIEIYILASILLIRGCAVLYLTRKTA